MQLLNNKPLVKRLLLFCVAYAGIWGVLVLGAQLDLVYQPHIVIMPILGSLVSGIFFLPPFAFANLFALQTKLMRFQCLAWLSILCGLWMAGYWVYDMLDGGIRGLEGLLYLLLGVPSAGLLSIMTVIGGCILKRQRSEVRFFGFAGLVGFISSIVFLIAHHFRSVPAEHIYFEITIVSLVAGTAATVIGFLIAIFQGQQQKVSA